MPVNSIARTVLRFQYSLVRSPLTALDAQVLGRLSDTSRIKMTLTRGLAGLDVAAGRLMNDPQLERRGDNAAERMAKTKRATQAEAKADALRAEADKTKQDGDAQAAHRRTEAARLERERIADALREETAAKHHVGELAEADAAEQKRQAELRAKHQQVELAEQRRAKVRRIAADKKRAAAPAKAQLKEAAGTAAVARSRRTNADTLDQLAGTEKAVRRNRSAS